MAGDEHEILGNRLLASDKLMEISEFFRQSPREGVALASILSAVAGAVLAGPNVVLALSGHVAKWTAECNSGVQGWIPWRSGSASPVKQPAR
jgi:hypothetical protein